MRFMVFGFTSDSAHHSSVRCAVHSVWNSLPASDNGSDSLSVFKSRLKRSYFVDPLTSTHNRLSPAPLELRLWRFMDMVIIIICSCSSRPLRCVHVRLSCSFNIGYVRLDISDDESSAENAATAT